MPRLLLLAPCERAIIERETNSMSLIRLLTGFVVQVPPGGFQTDTAIPIMWTAVTVWEMEPEDRGKEFEQDLHIIAPSGRDLGGGTVKFGFAKSIHQNTLNSNAFPVTESGKYQIRILLKEADSTTQPKVVGEYPMEVEHQEVSGG